MPKQSPNIQRKQTSVRTRSGRTGERLPKVDWRKIVKSVQAARTWLIESDDEASVEGQILADLFLKAIDEQLSPVERVEEILDGFGYLAFYWASTEHFYEELRQRAEVVARVASRDFEQRAEGFAKFISDPENLLRTS